MAAFDMAAFEAKPTGFILKRYEGLSVRSRSYRIGSDGGLRYTDRATSRIMVCSYWPLRSRRVAPNALRNILESSPGGVRPSDWSLCRNPLRGLSDYELCLLSRASDNAGLNRRILDCVWGTRDRVLAIVSDRHFTSLKIEFRTTEGNVHSTTCRASDDK
jgi:hypothetical protein